MGFYVRCVISCMSIFLDAFSLILFRFILPNLTHSLIKTNLTTKKTLSIDLRVWKIEINFIMNEFICFKMDCLHDLTWLMCWNLSFCHIAYARSPVRIDVRSLLKVNVYRKGNLCAKCSTWSRKWSEPKQNKEKMKRKKYTRQSTTHMRHSRRARWSI